MIKEFQIVRLDKDGRLVPDGYDMRTINEIGLFSDEYGWTYDTEEEAEAHIAYLLKSRDYKWKTFSIIPVYSFEQ